MTIRPHRTHTAGLAGTSVRMCSTIVAPSGPRRLGGRPSWLHRRVLHTPRAGLVRHRVARGRGTGSSSRSESRDPGSDTSRSPGASRSCSCCHSPASSLAGTAAHRVPQPQQGGARRLQRTAVRVFAPARDHPVFDEIFGKWQDHHLHGSNYAESTVYPGWVAFAPCRLTIALILRRKAETRRTNPWNAHRGSSCCSSPRLASSLCCFRSGPQRPFSAFISRRQLTSCSRSSSSGERTFASASLCRPWWSRSLASLLRDSFEVGRTWFAR